MVEPMFSKRNFLLNRGVLFSKTIFNLCYNFIKSKVVIFKKTEKEYLGIEERGGGCS